MGPYRSVAKPLLFALPPEAAHRLAHRLLGLPLPWERIGRAVHDPALRVRLAGIELANPIGLAAGFDKTGRHVDALGRLGFGYVVAGTFTRRPRRGNRRPRIVRSPERFAIVNAMGLPNPGAEAAARILARTPHPTPRLGERRRTPLFVKLPTFSTPVERDVVLALAAITREGGADGLTCSNTRPVPEPRLAAGTGGPSGRGRLAGTPRLIPR